MNGPKYIQVTLEHLRDYAASLDPDEIINVNDSHT